MNIIKFGGNSCKKCFFDFFKNNNYIYKIFFYILIEILFIGGKIYIVVIELFGNDCVVRIKLGYFRNEL